MPTAPQAELPGSVAKLIDFYVSPKAVMQNYRELELLTVFGWGRTRAEMIEELKDRTRELGADAIIYFDETVTQESCLNYSDSSCEPGSVQLQAMAIVYGDDADGTDDEPVARVPAGR